MRNKRGETPDEYTRRYTRNGEIMVVIVIVLVLLAIFGPRTPW